MNDIQKKILQVQKEFNKAQICCQDIAKEAKKHIDWSDEVSCNIYPNGGVCIEIESRVVDAFKFFKLVGESKDGMVDESLFYRNGI